MTGIYIPVTAAWYDVNTFYYDRQWLHPPTHRIEDWVVPDNTRYTAQEMAMYTGDMFLEARLKDLPPGQAMFLKDGPPKAEKWHPAIHHMSQQRANNEAELARLEQAELDSHAEAKAYYEVIFQHIPEDLRNEYARLRSVSHDFSKQRRSMEDKLRNDKEW